MLSDITYRLWIFCFKITILLTGGHRILHRFLLYNTRNANEWSIDNITIANTVFYFCTEVLVYKYPIFMNYISKNEDKKQNAANAEVKARVPHMKVPQFHYRLFVVLNVRQCSENAC